MIKIEVNAGSYCNYQCSYCFENGEPSVNREVTRVSVEHLSRLAEYIRWLKTSVMPEEDIVVVIFGGEPFMRLNDIAEFVHAADPCLLRVHIITNGSLAKENIDILSRMRSDNQCQIYIVVSYDYAFQNETRRADSYETVRNNIRFLYKNGFTNKTISVFSAKNIHRMDEVFFDFLELRKDLPELMAVFNIDRFGAFFTDIDEDAVRASLARIQAHMQEHPELKNAFFFNDGPGRMRREGLSDTFYSVVYLAMYYDGSLYPGYETALEDKTVADLLKFGSIDDDFESIQQNRAALLAKLPKGIPEKCMTCNNLCRVIPWRTMTSDLSEWNGMPKDPAHCRIHALLTEYLVQE